MRFVQSWEKPQVFPIETDKVSMGAGNGVSSRFQGFWHLKTLAKNPLNS
jgi:hypothetical protein